ncbi:MAG: DoxX family protein, partial [Verrucomicrobiota bacterium]|nr:DoxX family protein [Verrucomicrobiota bacterium]
MKEEFAVYGLPAWSVPIMRVLKLSLALALLVGYFYQPVVKPVAGALTVIMFVAVMMHLKLRRDPLVRALPSYLLLCFSIFLILD